MRKATLERVQARLGEYVARSAKQPVLILRDGEPVAMLIGLSRKAPKTRVKLREVLKGAWKDYDRHGAIPHDEFWQTLADEVNNP
jgi:antitoxin (DNA-binding transcriptional repressor) of toxin-antitoxin stability system